MLRTIFCLAMDINLVLDSNILIEVNHVHVSVNTIYIFPDQSKLILYYEKFADFNRGAITFENTSFQYSQIVAALRFSMTQ